jgi:iron complex outermembrane recepter protein
MLRMIVAASLAAASAAHASADEPETESRQDVIIVTGEKTERSLQDTVSSVAVMTAARIEQENVLDLDDIVQRTPNVSQTYGKAGFTIRGISNTSVSGGGDSSLATVYLDGAPLPSDILHNGPTDMWDVSQVELLRGPQSTLQGRASLAGAVIINSRAPSFEWDARARARFTDAEDRNFAIAGGGPLIEDQLAFRVSYEDTHEEGFVFNKTRNTSEDGLDARTLRADLLLTPSALPDFTARLSYIHSEREGSYLYTYSSLNADDYFEDRFSYADTPNSDDTTTDLAALNLEYDFSDAVSITSVTSWTGVDSKTSYDGDDGPEPLSYGNQSREFDTLTQELRLNYEGARLKGLVGLYYSDRQNDVAGGSLTNVDTPVETIAGLLLAYGASPAEAAQISGLYAAALPVIPVDFYSASQSDIETIAVFADGSYELTPRLSLLAGFRYDVEENKEDTQQSATFVGTYPDPANYGAPGSALYTAIYTINLGVAGYVQQASGAAPTDDPREFEAFLPKAGLEYDWTDDLSTSLVVQRGYRSGGTTTNVARSSVVPYDPEYTWNYEASFRSAWLDGALTVNANAFYTDWTDQQVTVNLGLNAYDYQTINAGKSHLYGAEIAINHFATDNFDWYAGLGYTKTEFDDFEVSVGTTYGDLSGSEFAFAPRWTASLGANYDWDNGFVANVNGSYQSDAYSSIGLGQESAKVDSRFIVNTRIGYQTDHYGLFVFANNLFDAEYVQYAQSGNFDRAMLGAPRVFGFSLEARL